jgi:ABC-2 type transport system permease protein
MTSLIRSELLKLRTARSFIILSCLGIGLITLLSLATSLFANYSPDDPTPGLDLISNASTVALFTLMLGVLSVTTEYRSGSIASTLLVEPNRVRVLAAKLIAVVAAGAAMALFTAVVALLIGEAILPGRDYQLGLSDAEVIELIAGTTAAGGLMAALGAGIGALVRAQTGAIVGVLVYLFVVEPLLVYVFAVESLEQYVLGSALSELTGTGEISDIEDPLGQLAGGLLLLGYACAFALLGAVMMRARDITD